MATDIRVPQMTEKQLQAAVVNLARIFQWRVYHSWISIRSAPGFPDIIACRGERLLAIELKSERGRATGAQLDWLAALYGAGVETFLLRPSDWHNGTVEKILRPDAPGGGE
jgi:hypothetical protein